MIDAARNLNNDKLINENIIANCTIEFIKGRNSVECNAINENLFSSYLASASYNFMNDHLFMYSPDHNYDLHLLIKNELYDEEHIRDQFEMIDLAWNYRWERTENGWVFEKEEIKSNTLELFS